MNKRLFHKLQVHNPEIFFFFHIVQEEIFNNIRHKLKVLKM